MPRSRVAVETIFEDLRPYIRAEARRFARTRGLEPDECVAEANLIFLGALDTFDRGRSRLVQRVRYKVRTELLSRYRTWARRNAKHPRSGVPESAAARPEPPPFDREGFVAGLSDDARTVVDLLLDTPKGLARLMRTDPDPGAASVKHHLQRYLTGLGWDRARVAGSFAEIAEALS